MILHSDGGADYCHWAIEHGHWGGAGALSRALASLAQQPDEANTITRTLFVGLALVESTAIYCFVVSMILIFANPFWNYFVEQAGGG